VPEIKKSSPVSIIHKVINAVANWRSAGERDLLETMLRQLPSAAYWRLKEKGFVPGGIMDIGAYEGQWTRTIRGIFPEPPILMIEARIEQKSTLERVCSDQFNVNYVIALLGHEAHEAVPFYVSGTGSSIFPERSDVKKVVRRVPMLTIDKISSETERLREPFFLKLDVQGAELDCLRGGDVTLGKAEIVQLEVALLNYNEAAPQAAEVIAFMDSKGFAIFDISGFIRPNAIDLVQLDIIFAKKTSSLRPDFFRFDTRSESVALK
jgi:FkbM family methyltransferase